MKNLPFRVVASSVDPFDNAYVLTIAVPTFKRPALLEETLRSVAALKFAVPVEVIVLDNDPDGDDVQAVELMRNVITGPYRYYRNIENVGMFGNWNQCIFQARGKYITILHDDDLLCAQFGPAVDKLLSQGKLKHEIVGFHVGMLEQRPDRTNAQAALPSAEQVKSFPAAVHETLSVKLFSINDLFFANLFCGTLAVIFNREHAIDLGGFRVEWAPIADYEFWCRWADCYGDIPFANWSVAQYRIGQNESMKLDIRTAFVVKSHEMRRHLIDGGAVPGLFASLLGIVTFAQRSQIYRDWRTAEEPPLSLVTKVAMRVSGKTLQSAAKVSKALGLTGSRTRTATQ
jgi:glycosyltransferase involved in cell wall biosynthesis